MVTGDKDLAFGSVLIAWDHAQIRSLTYGNDHVANCSSLSKAPVSTKHDIHGA